uniref:Major facilitator superfamily (MFS) profile domain-containing protein n=1 Tax=Candidozyma auris TaxID=498019 RepID=A0A0L0NSE2_CANAR
MPQTKASDSESVVKTTSDDKSIGEGAKEESKGYGLNPVLSSSTNLSTVKEKSFGIRRSELIMAQLKYWWVKALFFFTIFICSYISVLENAIVRVFDGYATESYKKHSLMSTIAILRGVVAAASLPFYARLSDNFGRFELFIVALLFRIVGRIIQSQATDVQKYAAGTVFFSFGNSGMRILWQINLADASSLKWRLAALSVIFVQSIITTWSSGEIVNLVLGNRNWEFGIAMWAFITPLVCLPYMIIFLVLILKARRLDAWREISEEEKESLALNNTFVRKYREEAKASETPISRFLAYAKLTLAKLVQTLYDIFWKVDFIGCLLLALILGLILVPLTLAGGTHLKWQQASTIVPIVLGFCSIPLFILWETKVTKRPMLPFQVMGDRGIWAGFLVAIINSVVMGMPNSYSYPVLLVGMNASETVATRTGQLNGFVEGIAIPIVGYVLSRVRRTKGFIIFGNYVLFIAMGLFVHFRGSNDGYRAKYFRDGVAVGMCLLGFANTFFSRVTTVSVQACTNHEYMATVIAIFAACYHVGGSIGSSISGAIWTQLMFEIIRRKMAALNVDPTLAKSAYQQPYIFAKQHKWGTEPRRAVSLAYAEVQKNLCITGLCLCVPLLVLVLFLRDHKLSEAQNLDDEVLLATGKDSEKAGEVKKSQVIFRNDNDYILTFLKRLRDAKGNIFSKDLYSSH